MTDHPRSLTAEDVATLSRVRELCEQFGFSADDTDTLKHRLEDHERWSRDVVQLDIQNEHLLKRGQDLLRQVRALPSPWSLVRWNHLEGEALESDYIATTWRFECAWCGASLSGRDPYPSPRPERTHPANDCLWAAVHAPDVLAEAARLGLSEIV